MGIPPRLPQPFRFAVAVAALSALPAAAAEQPSAPEAATPWEVYLVLEKHCAECHGGHLAKPKGKFGYILDLRRLIDEAYIVPANLERSEIYAAMTETDPDLHMPPLDSDGPQPTAAHIETVRSWIMAGAPIEEDEPVAANPEAATSSEKPPPTFGRVLGRLHPLLVHFPIALLLGACVAEISRRIRPGATWPAGMVRGSLWLGALGAIVAAACGWLNAHHEGFIGDDVAAHRWLGTVTTALAVAALAVHEWHLRKSGDRRAALLVVLIVVAAMVSLAGHTGGRLAYGDDYFWGF